MVTDRLGKNFFYRGMPERITKTKNIKYDTNLLDLVQAYARVRTKDEFRPYVLDRGKIYSMEEALGHLRKFLNFSGDWTELSSYLPEGWVADPEKTRSATASTFAACLELTKAGEIELKQTKMTELEIYNEIENSKTKEWESPADHITDNEKILSVAVEIADLARNNGSEP